MGSQQLEQSLFHLERRLHVYAPIRPARPLSCLALLLLPLAIQRPTQHLKG